jgi:Flp pilus assembly protein TadG
VAALLFLAFAFFAVGQAAVARNGAQSAADAAALGAATAMRDGIRDDFLAALEAGDRDKLADLLNGDGLDGAGGCAAAAQYADDNHADVAAGGCAQVAGPPGFRVGVVTQGTVGNSVIDGTENMKAQATATAVVEPRCDVDDTAGDVITFTCDDGTLIVNPTDDDFVLHLADFFSVHLSK